MTSGVLDPDATTLQPDAIGVLRAAGVAVPARGVTVTDVSRSHRVVSVALDDGRRYVVKTVSADARAQGRSLASELFVYRLVGWMPAVARALPRPVLVDERHQVLVLEAAPPERLFPARCLDPGFPGEAVAEALGRTLAVLHAATTGVPVLGHANCGVLDLPDTEPGLRMIGSDGSAAELADTVADDACLAEGLRRARRAMTDRCLVHGDLKWDNVVLDPVAMQLFDWELSGAGDPAWDLGGAVADTVSYAARLRGRGALASDPTAWVAGSATALLRGYGPGAPDLAERTTLAWLGRTVHLALECAAATDDSRHPAVVGLIESARALAEAVDDVVPVVRDAFGGRR